MHRVRTCKGGEGIISIREPLYRSPRRDCLFCCSSKNISTPDTPTPGVFNSIYNYSTSFSGKLLKRAGLLSSATGAGMSTSHALMRRFVCASRPAVLLCRPGAPHPAPSRCDARACLLLTLSAQNARTSRRCFSGRGVKSGLSDKDVGATSAELRFESAHGSGATSPNPTGVVSPGELEELNVEIAGFVGSLGDPDFDGDLPSAKRNQPGKPYLLQRQNRC